MVWNCRNNPRLLGKSKAPSQQPHVTTRSPPSISPEDELIKAGFKCVEALDRIVIRGQSGGGWCGCLSGARCRQLDDLHAIFLFQIISFKKYFYVSLDNNFFTVFVEALSS